MSEGQHDVHGEDLDLESTAHRTSFLIIKLSIFSIGEGLTCWA